MNIPTWSLLILETERYLMKSPDFSKKTFFVFCGLFDMECLI